MTVKNKSPEKKTYALDIFSILGKLSTGDTHLWDKLTEEEQKSLSPLILMTWMAGTDDLRQIYLLNELVNPYVFSIGPLHKELLIKLIAVASSKQQHRYSWVALKKKASTQSKLGITVLKEFYGYSTREANEVFHHLSKTEVLEMADKLGYQKDEMKKLTKELG